MKTLTLKSISTLLLAASLVAFALTPAQAQAVTTSTVSTSTTSTAASSATNAIDIAKDGVDPSLRNQVVSVYGVGTPASIDTWWVIFYDSSLPSHGRAVKVANGQIVRSYEAKGGVVYDNTLTFPPAQVAGVESALTAAQTYAAQHAIAYDHVRALLRDTTAKEPLRWRVQLLDGATSKGFVFVNSADGSFAMYSPPGSVPVHETSGTGSVAGDAKQAGDDIKNTFLGIGGDLQQFFTGERTVDQ